MRSPIICLTLLLLQWGLLTHVAESKCSKGCPLALASYYAWQFSNLTFIAQVLNVTTQDILSYNPSIPDKDRLTSGTRVNVPISCDCIDGEVLGHLSQYQIQKGDTYTRVAQTYFANLTTVPWIQHFNSYDPNRLPDNAVLNVAVNCSCGDRSVNDKYGLFLTYPLRPEDNISSIAQYTNSTPSLLRSYNPNANFSAGTGLVFIPAKDNTGKYPPMISSSGLSGGAIASICVAVVAAVTLSGVVYFLIRRRKKREEASSLLSKPVGSSNQMGSSGQSGFLSVDAKGAAGNLGITVDKSVEFSYEELAQATDDFSMANKIGAGGFGEVYYAELRGEKAAIKKMDMLARKEFHAEINVLTRVHHFNLVRLIGYCVENSLFLVYEYVENGNLSQHLRGSGRDPLSWPTRVQIALDSARGLEYIHEHTVPVYIHRDIKSANILIDKNFHAKVADFGLTKLTEVGAAAAPTRLVGTFGYMPPEYAQYGEASPKVDVYAFGVVLFELISAKEAVMRGLTGPDAKGLVGLFEDALSKPDHLKAIQKLVDPRLEDNYPLSSVLKMAELARACTQDNPQLRPSMRSVVVALMTLSSTTEEWDSSAFAQ